MGKKKRRGLLKNKTMNNDEKIAELLSVVHSGDGKKMLIDSKNLLDSDYALEPSRVAAIIKNQFENGTPPEDIAYHHYNVLTDVLTHLRVPGRSEATTKMEKATLLYKFFMGDVEPSKRKKKSSSKPKETTPPKPVWRRTNK